MITDRDVASFDVCVSEGGVAVFPADTVYGLGCDPENQLAVTRLYLLKRRPLEKPSAVMFFSVEAALAELGSDLGPRLRSAVEQLCPGGVTLLLPNPAGRCALACGCDPSTLGVRVPDVPALARMRRPILQSSANRAGGPDPRRLADVPELLRAGADLVLDGGELPGTPSTVVDLRRYEEGGIDSVSIIRQGAVGAEAVAAALAGQFHFNPATYAEMIHEDFPEYAELQDAVAAATQTGARVSSILELGTGTGETARRLLALHTEALLVGIDESEAMLAAAGGALLSERAQLLVRRLEDPLPDGPFDLVASALCVHHLDGGEKADLFARVREVLVPGGRFVLGDVIVPADPDVARSPLTPGFDKPSTVAEQVAWLSVAGFDARVTWELRDVAVIVADAPT